MPTKMNRRDFVATGAAAGLAAGLPRAVVAGEAPTVITQRTVKPVVIADTSGIRFKNGGPMSCVETAFAMISEGADVLDALIAGVNIPELDPEEAGVGYGGRPNADGVVQLDACCMHGPKKRAGGVAAIEGVRTPSLVAKAVMDYTDHHLLVGHGAQALARNLGFTIEEDLNTDRSREAWLEWKRRMDPQHYLDPKRQSQLGYEIGLGMVEDGIIDEHTFWGTVNCDGISPSGDICGVTTTSGLAFKIPGRTGDSPILGAGLYVDGDVGAPKDAGLEGLKRIKANTVEQRLLNDRGEPAFNIRFFVLNASGEYAGVAMYASGETTYAVCTENGAESRPLEPLLSGGPLD
jgi:N4-(beta-N-acetylglucosaminyl)-L-asparaginase